MNQLYYQPTGYNQEFPPSVETFSDYLQHIAHTREQVAKHLHEENSLKFSALTAPAEYLPPNGSRDKGILFIHGLLDTPYQFRHMIEHFTEQGFIVRTLLLPGHGTVPGDLLQIELDEWIKATRFGLGSLAKEVSQVYLAGFSTGGALGVLLALEDFPFAGLLLFAPALKIQNPLVALTKWGPQLATVHERWGWVKYCEENDFARYHSSTMRACYQVYLLTQQISEKIAHKPITCPIFLCASMEDDILNTDFSVQFLLKQPNPLNKAWLYSAHDKWNYPANITIRTAIYPQFKVLDFSHIGLLMPVDDPHYGFQGDYYDFDHYLGKLRELKQKKIAECQYGTISAKNLTKPILARTTFNPDFSSLKEQCAIFLENCRQSQDNHS